MFNGYSGRSLEHVREEGGLYERINKRKYGHGTEVVTLMGRRMVMLQFKGGRMVMLQKWSV